VCSFGLGDRISSVAVVDGRAGTALAGADVDGAEPLPHPAPIRTNTAIGTIGSSQSRKQLRAVTARAYDSKIGGRCRGIGAVE
jgi:hypothetical protein